MAYEFQVTVDCADPHVLADWWAKTLGWQVEPQDAAFIRRMISAGHAADGDTRLYNGALVWKVGAAICHPAARAAGAVPANLQRYRILCAYAQAAIRRARLPPMIMAWSCSFILTSSST
jgi:hypothetical protein